MTPTVERVSRPYTAPPGTLFLSPEGWAPDPYEVILQLNGRMTLEQALELVWQQHGGLLGEGQLSFKILEEPLRGYLLFTPTAD
jgi:hypothetical protein